MLRIGITGTSGGGTVYQTAALTAALESLLLAHGSVELHHGDCVGVDAEAHGIALDLGIPVAVHPPDKDRKRAYCQGAEQVYPPAPYLVRNHAIVDAVDLLLALPRGDREELRSGTWATVRYAKKRKVRTVIIPPAPRETDF